MKVPLDNSARWKYLSYLLMYPTGELRDAVGDLSELADEFYPGKNCPDNRVIGRYLNFLTENSVLGLQEVFSATFDLNPKTCLNLTYHVHGDGKKRGQALARFQEYYLDAGFAAVRSELPDYLPMVLEFLSVCSPETAHEIKKEYGETVGIIQKRLEQDKSPYAGLMKIIHETFKS